MIPCRHQRSVRPGYYACAILESSGVDEVTEGVCRACQREWEDGCPTAERLPPLLLAVVGNPSGDPVGTRSLLERLRQATAAFHRWLKAGGRRVTREQYHARLAACSGCDRQTRQVWQPVCSACGCFLRLKAWMGTESCPLRKWAGDPPRPERTCGGCGR